MEIGAVPSLADTQESFARSELGCLVGSGKNATVTLLGPDETPAKSGRLIKELFELGQRRRGAAHCGHSALRARRSPEVSVQRECTSVGQLE